MSNTPENDPTMGMPKPFEHPQHFTEPAQGNAVPMGNYEPVKIAAPVVGEQTTVPADHQLGQHVEG